MHGPRPPERRLEVFFSNPDVLWANEFPAPRFGQGGFVAALEGLYNKVPASSAAAPAAGQEHMMSRLSYIAYPWHGT